MGDKTYIEDQSAEARIEIICADNRWEMCKVQIITGVYIAHFWFGYSMNSWYTPGVKVQAKMLLSPSWFAIPIPTVKIIFFCFSANKDFFCYPERCVYMQCSPFNFQPCPLLCCIIYTPALIVTVKLEGSGSAKYPVDMN